MRFRTIFTGLAVAGALALSVPAAMASTPSPTPSASVTAGSALTASCATGNFNLELVLAPTLYIESQGHNNPVIMQGKLSAAPFCLVNSGTTNWYEFMDTRSGECLNALSPYVYEDGCSDTTQEQWNQSIPGDHEWENRHYGTNGLLTGSASPGARVTIQSGGLNTQSWATPGA